jgi:GH25 family lysozyme M1 (1,4-beta-N-acetylmuramidase)
MEKFGIKILAAATAIAVMLTGCGFTETPDPTPTPETVYIYGSYVTALDQVERSAYSDEGFHEADGFIEYSYGSVKSEAVIDVSEFQGDIDWQAVADAGIKMAIIRAGYRGYSAGGVYEDSRFKENAQAALDAGLQVGAYFFSQAVTPAEAAQEAEAVIEAIGDLNVAGPVVFDWEAMDAEDSRTADVSGDVVTDCAVTFCREVAAAGLDPWVYMGMEAGYLVYDLTQLTDYKIWFAQYSSAPDFYYAFHMWQYTDSGTVPGIDGTVDLNILFVRNDVTQTTTE